MDAIKAIQHDLFQMRTPFDFDRWARQDFRLMLPSAALLVTVGRLYGVGSVPTHRLSVDFPLELIEMLKNSAGALNDPPVYGWFRTQKLMFFDIQKVDQHGAHQTWRNAYLEYGFNQVLVHGSMDHLSRRFATFQIFNAFQGLSSENTSLLSSIVNDMARAVWRIFLSPRDDFQSKTELIGHPTLALTSTELHIVQLLAQGLSNKEIARLRGVSDSTVKTQVQRTGSKVGAKRRAEIVALALPFLSPLPPQSLIDYGD